MLSVSIQFSVFTTAYEVVKYILINEDTKYLPKLELGSMELEFNPGYWLQSPFANIMFPNCPSCV